MWAVFVAMGREKKGGGEWKIEDFMPKEKKLTARSTEDLIAMAKHLNAMMGGRDLTKKRTVNGDSR